MHSHASQATRAWPHQDAVERSREPLMSQPGDASEREADQTAESVIAGTRPNAELAVRPLVTRAPAMDGRARGAAATGVAPPAVAASPGRPLDSAVRSWFGPRFGRDLSGLLLHDDAHAAALSRSLGARAFAQERDLYFGTGEYAPATDRGRWLIAHEIAHTFQHHAPGRIAGKTLTDLPAASRRKLKVSRSAPAQADISIWTENYFNPKSGISISSPIAAEFGTEITDTNQQKGLQSIATELAKRTSTDPEAWALPTDGILDLALDLRPHAGEHAIYRFTRHTHGTADTVLIEKIQVLAPAPGARAAPAAAPATQPAAGGTAPTFTGEVHVGSVTITIGSSFSDAQGKAIADAVRLLPDPIRTKVDGVSFVLAGTGKGPHGQNGDYQSEKDVVRIWSAMFDTSPRRVGGTTSTAYQVVHELGHAIDLRPEFKAQRERAKAEERKKTLETELRNAETKFIDLNDPLGGIAEDKDPRVVAEKKRIQGELDKVRKEIAAQSTAMASAKSVAGNELGRDVESMLTDFGKAIAADGVAAVPGAKKRNRAVEAANEAAEKANAANPAGPQTAMKPLENTLAGGVSNYAANDLMDAFAENFAYYALDEALFKAIRPKTYAFFTKAFPKTVRRNP